MKLTTLFGLAAIAASAALLVPPGAAQAATLAGPGIAAAMQGDAAAMTTEVRHRGHRHWRHKHYHKRHHWRHRHWR